MAFLALSSILDIVLRCYLCGINRAVLFCAVQEEDGECLQFMLWPACTSARASWSCLAGMSLAIVVGVYAGFASSTIQSGSLQHTRSAHGCRVVQACINPCGLHSARGEELPRGQPSAEEGRALSTSWGPYFPPGYRFPWLPRMPTASDELRSTGHVLSRMGHRR